MRYFITLLIISLLYSFANAQPETAQSLRKLLENATSDSANFHAYMNLGYYYEELDNDSALYFSNQAFLIAEKNNQPDAEAMALNTKGYQLLTQGQYKESLKCLVQAYDFVQNSGSQKNNWNIESRLLTLAANHHMFGLLMNATGNTEQEIFHYRQAIKIGEEIGDSFRIHIAYSGLVGTYGELGMFDSALFFSKKAEAISLPEKDKKYFGWHFFDIGNIYFKMGNADLAKQNYYKGMAVSIKENNKSCLASIYNELTKLYLFAEDKDSSLYYARQTIRNVNALGHLGSMTNNIGTAYENLYLSFKLNNQFDRAFKYQGLALNAKDSLYKRRIKNLTDFQNLSFSEELRLQHAEKEKVVYQDKIRTYALLSGIAIFMLIAFLLYRNNRSRRKANELLKRQKEEIEVQKKNAEQTLAELNATQAQLIQSEKMASLGELTAGIAHEIQNPLNFVNNFSEVNKEMVDELQAELKSGSVDEAFAISNDIKDNSEKINHYGKRADAIVKGMLQHSRQTSGTKEPTDINALTDEYLRLAYHGLKAKDNSFNAIMKTDFDETLGKINIVPQDIGRVLLNLYNNAFYAVCDKKQRQLEAYEPTVSVQTKKVNDSIEIIVTDNGNGIPQKVVDKIFQPFFTTKPTGQGTGLGLSLSYDIIKTHGGEIKVESREGEGSEFIIQLPGT